MFITPDSRASNPYQQLLANAAAHHGIDAVFNEDRPRFLLLFRWIRQLRADVLHLDWIDSFCLKPTWRMTLLMAARFFVDLALVRLSGVPVVWVVHNFVSHESRFPLTELWIYRITARLVSRVLIHQNASRGPIHEAYAVPLEKLSVVPLETIAACTPARAIRSAHARN